MHYNVNRTIIATYRQYHLFIMTIIERVFLIAGYKWISKQTFVKGEELTYVKFTVDNKKAF